VELEMIHSMDGMECSNKGWFFHPYLVARGSKQIHHLSLLLRNIFVVEYWTVASASVASVDVSASIDQADLTSLAKMAM
jgi:hypothetical protein